jgi:HK97 family phage major capsid protein
VEAETLLKEYNEKQQKLWTEYTKTVDEKIAKVGEQPKIDPETKTKLDKMEVDFGDLQTKIDKAIAIIEKKEKEEKDLEKKIKDLEAKLNRPQSGGSRLERKDFILDHLYKEATKEDAEEKAMAMWDAVKMGIPARTLPAEHKALTFGDPETGGYLGPPDFVNEIIKELRETTPVMQIAKSRTTSANSMMFPKKTGTISASRRGESESKSEATGLTFGGEQVTLPEMYAYLDVSEMDLEDTGFDLESEMREEIIDAFAAKLGEEFITGSGPLQLEGILTNADIAETKSGSNSALQPEQLITFVVGTLKQQHQVNARLMFRLATLAAIRILQVPTVGGFIWAPGFEKTPATIMGKPYVISEDMPAIEQDAYPIAFGDFKKGYMVGQRIRFAIKRITDSALDQAGNVRISARSRIGGRVTLAPAIIKHKIST